MEKELLSRQYLETLSTKDLMAIADEYGIDIPDNLNRRFIIGELLETSEEFSTPKDHQENSMEESQDQGNMPSHLPESYNDTTIDAVNRNPAWVFAFWDIKESDMAAIKAEGAQNSLFLHIAYFDDQEQEKSCDSFDVNITMEDKEMYIFLSDPKAYFVIDLCCKTSDGVKILAYTRRMEVQKISETITNSRPGKELDVSELTKLSGMKYLLHNHYMNHREEFSN